MKSKDLVAKIAEAVARTLTGGGVYIHISSFCPMSFFSNQIQTDQFEMKFARSS